jgi:hypothetical protein
LISYLALTDIYYGESDVSLEWSILQFCALVILIFIISALFTLRKALREFSFRDLQPG